MDLIEDTESTKPRRVLIRSTRIDRVQMPSLAEAARRLASRAPPAIDPDAYGVLQAVWHTYPLAARGWRSVIAPDHPKPERWAGLRDGIPLLDETMVQWDAAPLRQQYGRLLRLFRSPVVSRLAVLKDLQRHLTLHSFDPIHWAHRFFEAEFLEPRPELTLGGYIIQPFLYAYARQAVRALPQEDWQRVRCPICSGAPYHGYLHPRSGQKVLICGKCLCPWLAPRLTCPFCANTNQDSLGYFYQDQAGHHRVDYCTACRSLLPITLDPESTCPFPIEDHLITLPLLNAIERRRHDH